MRDVYSAYPIRAHAYLMPYLAVPNEWLLTGVEVAADYRGKGIARELLQQVLSDADAEQVTLYLEIAPDGTGMDGRELRAWYERLGFVYCPGSIGTMCRLPRIAHAKH